MPNNGSIVSRIQDDPAFRELAVELGKSDELMCSYRCVLREMETRFHIMNECFSLHSEDNPITTIKTRLKTPESIYEKLIRRGFPVSVESIEENLYDVAGVRVICAFVDDVYRVADELLKQKDIVLVEMKDYIQDPKDNGYRSLHLLLEVPIYLPSGKKMVKTEVQLRTIAMEFWANLEHKMRYKKDMDEALSHQISEELRVCALRSAETDRRMQKIRYQIENSSEEDD